MKDLLLGRNVTLTFGGIQAVNGVDFEVVEGEILGLIGPNGAGKTSLLNCISQIYPLTDGSILFNEQELNGLSQAQVAHLGIARTFQIVRPFSGLTVCENVAVGAMFGSAGLGVAAAIAKAEEMLSFVGLSHCRDIHTTEIPTAYRKKLELARALCMEPKLILLDEVLAGLSPSGIEEVVRLIQRVRDLGVTVLMVEHVVRPMMKISDRVLVLHHGKKLASGTPTEVSSDPEVIRAYLGHRYGQVAKQ
jgi:branched-chain amino acid transport system ATP-binding protein